MSYLESFTFLRAGFKMTSCSGRDDKYFDCLDLDGLVEERRLLRSRKTRTLNDAGGNKSADELASIVVSLTSVRQRLEELDQRILSLLVDAKDMDRARKERHDALDIQDEIESQIAVLNRRIDRLDREVTTQSSSSCTPGYLAGRSIPAPKSKVPTFHGDPMKYAEWWGLFKVFVHDNPALSIPEKFFQLAQALKDEAADVIAGVRITDKEADYLAVVNEVKETFGDPTHLVSLFSQRLINAPAASESPDSIRHLVSTFENSLREIKHASEDETEKVDCPDCGSSFAHRGSKSQLNLFLAPLLLSKLPDSVVAQWKRSCTKVFDLDALIAFLKKEIRGITGFLDDHVPRQSREGTPQSKNSKKHATMSALTRNGSQDFLKRIEDLPVGERLGEVARRNLCRSCLRPGHWVKSCRLRQRCKVCRARHHTSLHEAYAKETNAEAQKTQNSLTASASNDSSREEPPSSLNASVSLRSSARTPQSWMQTVVIEVSCGGGKTVRARALIDTGSEETYCTDSLQRAVGAPVVKRETFASEVFGGKRLETKEQERVQISVRSRHGGPFFNLKAWTVNSICSPLRKRSLKGLQIPRDVKLAETYDGEEMEIDLLLGEDCWGSILLPEAPVKGNGILLVPTIFGHTIVGIRGQCGHTSQLALRLCRSMDPTEDFWSLESVGIDPRETKDVEAVALEPKLLNGRYEVCLPWKGDARPAMNLNQATARLKSVLRQPTEKREAYERYLVNLHEEGILEPCSNPSYLLPHHGVWRNGKLRVVYDGASKSPNGLSINDTLETGPNLQQPLVSVFQSFRESRNVLSGDVQKAFLQVSIAEKDRDFLSLLWKQKKKTVTSRFSRLPFGLCCSPWVLQSVLHEHLNRMASKYEATLIAKIRRGLYVDDVGLGEDDPDLLVRTYETTKEIFSQAGMVLHKWKVGGLDVQQDHVKEDWDTSPGKVLGVEWTPKEDILVFRPSVIFSDAVSTKARLLSSLMKLFDPMGMCLPWTVRLRIVFQDLWRGQIGWDDPLPSDIAKKVETLRMEALENDFTIPRFTGRPAWVDVFADASPRCYSATLYVNRGDGRPSELVIARAKVAPLNPKVSLPRLELLAAVLAVRLYRLMYPGVTVRFWTDSRVALSWIRGTPDRWKLFVRNRVIEISEFKDSWNWVPGTQNPADLATRGISAATLRESELWWNGPEFTRDNASFFVEKELEMTGGECLASQAEARKALVTSAPETCQTVFDLERHSTYKRAVRVAGWCFHLLKRGNTRNRNDLRADEIETGRKAIIRQEQERYLFEELRSLETSGMVDKSSRFASFHPEFSDDGIIVARPRTGGALVVLPPESRFVELIIKHAHELTGHMGVPATIAEVQRSYWIPRLRGRTRFLLHGCVACKKSQGRSFKINEAQLPDFRVSPAPPFSHCGIDHCGPFQLLEGKAWILIFSCAVTRGIHLELVRSLDVQATINAFRRFQARRGPVQFVMSDNGKSFRSLQAALTHLEWRTIPESSPWWGGFYERAVGIVKAVLKKLAQKCEFSYDDFSALMATVESMVNRRPLCSSEGPDVGSVLTPMHFLTGAVPPPLLHPVVSACDNSWTLTRRWKRLHQLSEIFWKEWVSSYLPQLRKWRREAKAMRAPEVGEVVLVECPPYPRGFWPLGKIVRLLTGPDGCTRAAEVLIKGRLTRRPVQRLIPLEVCREGPVDQLESVDLGENEPPAVEERFSRSGRKITKPERLGF